MSPPVLRRALLSSLVLVTGCAGMVSNDDWQPRPRHAPLPAVFVEVSSSTELSGRCGYYPGQTLYGCAIRDYPGKVCRIYTAPNPQPWLRTHELAHCAGYDHGPSRPVSTALR